MSRPPRSTLLLGILIVLLFPACGTAQVDEDQLLLDLNRRLFVTQILDQDPTLLLSRSNDSYVVIAPGGVVESRSQVVVGLRAFVEVDSLTLENERVVKEGETAVVLSRLLIHRRVGGPVGQLGPASTMTVFHRLGSGEWHVVARTLTPCNPMAVSQGIC